MKLFQRLSRCYFAQIVQVHGDGAIIDLEDAETRRRSPIRGFLDIGAQKKGIWSRSPLNMSVIAMRGWQPDTSADTQTPARTASIGSGR